MTLFVDTAALLAVLDGDDQYHQAAAATWRTLLERDVPLVTTNYVLVETFALIQRRLGIEAVRTFSEDFVPLIEVVWVDRETHDAAVSALLTAARRHLSLVDCTSFEVMRRRGMTRALAFDADFARQGFTIVPAT